MRKLGKLKEWLAQFSGDAEFLFECSNYGDDALIIVKTPEGEYRNSKEIEGFHTDRFKGVPCLKSR